MQFLAGFVIGLFVRDYLVKLMLHRKYGHR